MKSILTLSALTLSAFTAEAALDLVFENNSTYYDTSDVWISFDNGGGATPFDVTYNGGTAVTFGTTGGNTNHLTSGIRLSDVTGNKFTINSVSSVAVFVSYGSKFSDLTASPSFFSGSPGSDVTYQNFEITRTGGSGDQGNLTNINYFTAPMSISSYSSSYNSGNTALQSTGFSQTTAQIARKLDQLSPSSAVYEGGKLRRFVGPSTYTENAPFPSFKTYVDSVNTSGVSNNIKNSNAFNTNGATSTTGSNYNFTFNLTSAVNADGDIVLTGNITTEVKDNASGSTSAGTTYTDASITISGSDEEKMNQIIYGQTAVPDDLASQVTYGQGWQDWAAFVQNPDNDLTDAFPPSAELDNLTLTRTAIGEITTAILMGFFGNTNEVNGTALDTMESNQWWQLDPMKAFDEIQPDNPFYNEWAQIIYDASNNGSYSIPFSDRLGSGPLVNSVQYTEGGTSYDIDKWIVGFGDPVDVPGTIPEPTTAGLLLGLGACSLAASRRRRN
ncbi:PEP-CTERM sorting domain-containing protein [Puniceicoccus vermicola]|uniref:PEP-CTERM sorting domain-containing protein n=1 Tax=Puniceicoccus vermicola TaxID=388746 RepID=A0A7X1B242_9BACT|nr:PEP-CTERM sorting domain-containing protein [Puniceicoccus vermicola]MBC2604216.1 PEP-CTERM sorting domain-containing protein [Puniceicoccus vermicola]